MNNDTVEKTTVYNNSSNIQNTAINTDTTSRPSSVSATTTSRPKTSDRPTSTPHTTSPNKVPKNAHSNNYIKQYMLYKAQEKDFGALDILQQPPRPSLPPIHKNRPTGNVTLTNRNEEEEEEEGEGEDYEGYVSDDGMHYYRH